MQKIYPDYYKEFTCIADKCRHSCCIGWEIDIDEESIKRYEGIKGDFAKRLSSNISYEGTPHFILGKDERCPFLNEHNLCDMILSLGEDSLCGICREHPRFYNELPGRIEAGLGLCCEEAARIILGKQDVMRLEECGERECEDDIIRIRDMVLQILQNREKDLNERICDMYSFLGIIYEEKDIGDWADILLSLERLDENWTDILVLLKNELSPESVCDFEKHMENRKTEYEQFMIYLIYRYFANAFCEEEMKIRAIFAVFACKLIKVAGAALYAKNGSFSFAEQTELAHMFSSEIEYSDENRERIFDEIYNTLQ